MWISKQAFEDLLKRQYEAVGTAQALERQVLSQKSTMEWMTFRLTQLEHERAQLIFNYMGIKIAVPSVEAPVDSKRVADALNETVDFRDVGDVEAARLGLGWNEAGEVVQTGRVSATPKE